MDVKEPKTLIVPIGPLDDLDQTFVKLDRDRCLELDTNTKQDWAGDVLLASWGPHGTGGLYVFSGILMGVKQDGKQLSFDGMQRFWHPIVAVYEKAGIRRPDLIDIEGWGPSGHYYGLPGIASLVAIEAERSLSTYPKDREAIET